MDRTWTMNQCPLREMMDTIQEGFYFIDTGATVQGFKAIHAACDTASSSLRSRHPAAFVHLLQGLGAERPADRQLSGGRFHGQNCEMAVILNGQRRVIECDSCDTSVSEHYHCKTCYDGHYDLCDQCVASGEHCLDGDHWLFRRVIDENGRVVDCVTDAISPLWLRNTPPKAQRTSRPDIPGRAARNPVLHAGTAGTSGEALPYVFSFLLRMARQMLGVFHPMSLLLELYRSEADVSILKGHILSIIDGRIFHDKNGVLAEPHQHCMRSIRSWILYQQGRYHELDSWTSASLSGHDLDATRRAELMRLLAKAKTEENQVESAVTWLRAAWIALCEADLERSFLATRILEDLASLGWQVNDLKQCETG